MKNTSKRLLSLVLVLVMVLGMFPVMALADQAKGSVYDMKVCNLTQPLGIDKTPMFSWMADMEGFGKAQSAYQIIVSSTAEKAAAHEGDLWDSGKIAGADNFDVAYAGAALTSKTPYYWCVQVWDEADASMGWSEVDTFETGILNQSEWTAQWITSRQAGASSGGISFDLGGANWIWSRYGAAQDGVPQETMYFRGSFTVNEAKTVDHVYFGMTTDDYGVAYINGTKATEVQDVAEAWRSGTLVDVTELVKSGSNTIAAQVTNSSSGYAGYIAKTEIHYTDGTKETAVTDGSWKLTKTPADGWQNESFDASQWETPDQVLSYGSSPWGKNVSLTLADVGEDTTVSAPMLRKSFEIGKEVTRARAYVCGLGLFEMKVNGQYPDDSVLNPAHTQYEDTVNYRVFDVTDLLQQGKNAITAELGNSFYNCDIRTWSWPSATWRDNPKFILELLVEYADGTSQTIVTDNSWKSYAKGPITENDIYTGETYDARRVPTGWEAPDYDDSKWDPAYSANAPRGKLTFEAMEPMRRLKTLTPEVIDKGNGTFIVRSPEMVTGWAKILFNAPAGTSIHITYGETLNGSGMLNKLSLEGKGLQSDVYICSGQENEVYEPKFSYKGFEYIQIDNYPGTLKPEDVECYLIATDVGVDSVFETSSAQINALHDMAVRTMQNNMQGKPTDTPVYEKNGWTGDYNVSLRMFNYNFNMTAFAHKFLGDMGDSFTGSYVPLIVPTANWGMSNYPVWNSAYINSVYEAWKSDGQFSDVVEHYDRMAKQARSYISSIRGSWICGDGQLADWLSPDGSDSASEGSGICATAYVYLSLNRMAEIADVLGKESDAAEFRSAAENIYNAFNAKFYNAEKGYYETTYWSGGGSRTKYRQTSNLVPLAFGLVPEEHRASVVASLVDHVVNVKNTHLDTGVVGTQLLLPVLSEEGYADLAYAILTQTTYPSWGYWLEQGSNSGWEGYGTNSRSRDHYFLCTYDEWLHSHLAGIRDPENGYETVTIDPYVNGELSFVDCKLNTVRGQLRHKWTLNGDSLTMDVTIPVGTTAQVWLPVTNAERARVNGNALNAQDGIVAVAAENGKTRVTVGSGTYTFVMESVDFSVSRTALTQAVKSARNLDSFSYEAEGWAVFAEVLARAEAVLADENASQEQINNMAAELKAAMEALAEYEIIPVDRSMLETAVASAKSLQEKSYEADAWAAFQTVLARAEAVLADPAATQEAVEAMAAELNAAVTELGEHLSLIGNLALNKPFTVSSTLDQGRGSKWHKDNLVDGDTQNVNQWGQFAGWTSNNSTNASHEEWVIIDLGTVCKVNCVDLYPGGFQPEVGAVAYSFPKDLEIAVSVDNATWTPVVTETDYPSPVVETANVSPMQSFSFDDATARYVRVKANALNPILTDGNSYRMQLAEIEIYYIEKEDPSADQAAAVDALIEAIGEVTLDSKEAIEAARTAYDALTDEAKALVTKLDVLAAAEAAYELLVNPPITDVTLLLSAKDEVKTYEGDMVYTLSAEDMVKLANMIVRIDLDETIFANPVAEPAEGWTIVAQSWKDGVLNVALVNMTGVSGSGDIMTVTATPTGAEGEAAARVIMANLTAYEGEGETFVAAILDKAAVTTTVTAYHTYDVNRDGVVNQLDMTRAQRFFGKENDLADVNDDGEVDINDLILILNHFSEKFD